MYLVGLIYVWVGGAGDGGASDTDRPRALHPHLASRRRINQENWEDGEMMMKHTTVSTIYLLMEELDEM